MLLATKLMLNFVAFFCIIIDRRGRTEDKMEQNFKKCTI